MPALSTAPAAAPRLVRRVHVDLGRVWSATCP
ncbi:hypothetical protein FHR93_001955 [Geodermatophilus sabuli]|nr:hypothetical protein [Geodermatophilus sabuli]